jgi:threonine aldolase
VLFSKSFQRTTKIAALNRGVRAYLTGRWQLQSPGLARQSGMMANLASAMLQQPIWASADRSKRHLG